MSQIINETPILENVENIVEEVINELLFTEADISPPENRRKSIIRTPNSTPRTRKMNKLGFKETVGVLEFDRNSPLLEDSKVSTKSTSDNESLLRNRPRRVGKLPRSPRTSLIQYDKAPSVIGMDSSLDSLNSLSFLKPCFAEVKRDQDLFNTSSFGTFEFSEEMDESLDMDMDSAFSEIFNQPDLPRKRRSLDVALTMSQSDEQEERSPTKVASSSQQTELLEIIKKRQVVKMEEDKANQSSQDRVILKDVSNVSRASQDPPSSSSEYIKLLQDQCFSTPPTFTDQSFKYFDHSFEIYAPEESSDDVNGIIDETVIEAPFVLPETLNKPGPSSPIEDRTEPTIRVLPATYFLDNRQPMLNQVRSSFSELLGPHCGGMLSVKQTTLV